MTQQKHFADRPQRSKIVVYRINIKDTKERGYLKWSSKFRITELQKTTLLRRKHAGNTIFKISLFFRF